MLKESEIEIESKVKEIIADQLGVGEYELTGTTNLEFESGADDLDMFTISMRLEEKFQIDCAEDEVSLAATIEGIIKLVVGKM